MRNSILYAAILVQLLASEICRAQVSISVDNIVYQKGDNPCGSVINDLKKSGSGGIFVGSVRINGFRFDVSYCAWGLLGTVNIRWIVRNATNHDACITYSFNYTSRDGFKENSPNSGDGNMKCKEMVPC